MNHLRSINGEKSLAVIKDFCEAVAEADNPELEDKRQMAEKALTHLGDMFNMGGGGSTDPCPDCINNET